MLQAVLPFCYLNKMHIDSMKMNLVDQLHLFSIVRRYSATLPSHAWKWLCIRGGLDGSFSIHRRSSTLFDEVLVRWFLVSRTCVSGWNHYRCELSLTATTVPGCLQWFASICIVVNSLLWSVIVISNFTRIGLTLWRVLLKWMSFNVFTGP